MNIKKVLKIVGKNLLIFILSGLGGIFISVRFLMVPWMENNLSNVGLGIIALIPVIFIFFALGGLVVGGILGVLLFNFIRSIRRKKS